MSSKLLLAAVAAIIIGVVLYVKSSKERGENGQWSNGLQWAYLLVLAGLFGLLSSFMSFTAVLLIFVAVSGVLWLLHKGRLKNAPDHRDPNPLSDYMSGFFPIILLVFVVRAFVVEPFQIPSSSMRPGLVVGDFILVNKFSYGIRTPIINNVLIETGKVGRGDVAVFNYPENPDINYIKRVIGLPGDTVEYRNKVLTINGETVAEQPEGSLSYAENTQRYGVVDIVTESYREQIGGHSFQVLKMDELPSFIPQNVRNTFPYREHCQYEPDGSAFTCKVPQGHYFMMGDNRDNSEDSRYWGFVDDKFIVGKAFFIWMNFGDLSRIGSKIH
ncbi:signal peptidase I [Neisseria sp. ZJ106]|uniref:Signal peptidase I n=1 Tax=Neisseria lisongii TaxID=2912188 RepID=A0AAW5AN52_9NEIS|nr:signal peptidase I [Neisseria lisongii]MCF7520725.1 signal peptidase I [Neisseria lisongii]MCF7528878.1 signal peptidase I [Neisseria lisongii]WCL72371.1 signal peptidase I [Neisseria lisongii]